MREISEHANNLLNEFGKLQFDFAITLNNSLVSERDTARDNLANYIAELELELNNTKFHAKALQELLTKSMDRTAELEGAQRWIPVGERLPEPYTRVLACIKSGYMEVDYMYSEPIVDVGIADFNSLDNVTHWMPLPTPPEATHDR